MNFNEYQEKAVRTAIYPLDAKIIYPALGLAGEAGEVAEKVMGTKCPATQRDALGLTAHSGQAANQVKKIIRDDGGALSTERRDAIGREIGGCLWYIAALAYDLGLNLSDIAENNIAILASRQERGVISGDGDKR